MRQFFLNAIKYCYFAPFWIVLAAVFLFFIENGLCARTFFDEYKQVVVIDPGHGGKDAGAKGPLGLCEKEVALNLANMIKNRLTGIYKVHLTRTGDYSVDLFDRTALANQHKADLFISLHIGSCGSAGSRNASVFRYSRQNVSDPDAKHDFSRGTSGPDTDSSRPLVPWSMVQLRHRQAGKKGARHMAKLLMTHPDEKQVAIKSAPVAVLKGADMPALLVEIGCITSHAGERKLKDDAALLEYAVIIAEAVDAFFKAE